MNRAKYRLQSVMDARERLKQEAARLVASRRAQLDEAERELARRESALEECREQKLGDEVAATLRRRGPK
jgi:sugar-specific transcriptional regulator TrmB